MNKEEEPTLHGFIARLQAKSVVDRSFMERKYIEAMKRRERRK